jgi:hypothetical protein
MRLVPRFSPDGRWIAYRSDGDIWVRPFPARTKGSTRFQYGDGRLPFWSNNRHELFYEAIDHRIMVRRTTPWMVMWSILANLACGLSVRSFFQVLRAFDIAPDGKRDRGLTLPELRQWRKKFGACHDAAELRQRVKAAKSSSNTNIRKLRARRGMGRFAGRCAPQLALRHSSCEV